MKKTISMILAAFLLSGSAALTVTAADEEPVNLAEYATIISSGAEFLTGSAEDAFDGSLNTWCDFAYTGDEYWIGIQLDRPTILSYVALAGRDQDGDGHTEAAWDLHGDRIEGSNDGENWELILQLGEPYYEWEIFCLDYWEPYVSEYWTEDAFDGEDEEDEDAMEPVAYTYYRVWNYGGLGFARWGEAEFWGTFVEDESEEPEAPEYMIGDLNGDEAVDIADAVLLFQHSMVPDLYPIDYAGDVDFNADGVVDISDAVLLFQHSMVPDLYPLG